MSAAGEAKTRRAGAARLSGGRLLAMHMPQWSMEADE